MTLPPLPKPFASLPDTGSQTTSIKVWTSDAMEAYATAAVLAEREGIAQWLDGQGQPGYAIQIRFRNDE